jgi:putative phosphoesterase
MHIGLLSDTHDYLDPKIYEIFSDCDEIWHAGDFGTMKLVRHLEEFKPLRGVFGNIDERGVLTRFPEDLWFECEGLTIWMTHIAGAPPNYNPRVRKVLAEKIPDILICGHSHILKVIKDIKNDFMYINPGAAGNQGFHHVKTIMRFDITNREIQNLEVIELGRRGELD